MKQTAVEWLIEKILSIPLEEATNVAHLKEYVNKLEVFEQAKEMEKQQIIDAGQECFYCGWDIAKEKKPKFRTAEHYYNETFKNK